MSTLKQTLQHDLTEAMRARDQVRTAAFTVTDGESRSARKPDPAAQSAATPTPSASASASASASKAETADGHGHGS